MNTEELIECYDLINSYLKELESKRKEVGENNEGQGFK